MKRCRIEISGLVQGVGFRLFVYRTAALCNVSGFVRNTLKGVTIEAEGSQGNVDAFVQATREKRPDAARVESVVIFDVATQRDSGFRIDESDDNGTQATAMPHDRAPCTPCITEMTDPKNRRYCYPFITCNHCRPRFTIAEALLFDREQTTMASFELYELCRLEFQDPNNRRFHAQTIWCAKCGQQLSFHKLMNGEQQRENALTEAVSIIKQGGLIAIKGTGGYQLVCSALASKSIARIRRFKERQLKPFAVMVPSVADVAQLCKIKFSCDVIEFSGHTKSAFALAIKNSLILSEHIGDLGSQRSHDVFRRELQSFERLCGMDAQSSIVCRDAHPEYGSSILAEELSKNTQSINHHEAHLASLTAERNIGERILVVVCDDTGLGADNTIWGDEFSLIENNECTRIGSLLPFRLPGGERAVNETRRSALDMIYETYGDKAASGPFVLQEITDAECPLLMSALKPNINAPYTTSLGRLFDGLNALPGLCSISDYEAQAPMSMSLLPTVHAEFYRLCLESSCQESVKRPSDHSSLLRRFR